MDEDRFRIVFEKLSELTSEQTLSKESSSESEQMRAEIDEIAELRRLVLEITEPKATSYTST